MPRDSLFTNPSPPVERQRSILSRFSSPLTQRSTKLFELDIEPDHPHKTYRPGDTIKGLVVLSVAKGFEITHLTVSLHGYARVFKHQCTQKEAKNAPEQLINGKGSHGFEYLGNGLASLFQDEQPLCGSGFLKKQVYKFEFELQFPDHSLPSTIEFERGAVNYMMSATVTRPTAIAPTTNRIKMVKFQDRIDIEPMYVPKSRAIFLEPVSRRGKVKKVKQASMNGTLEGSSTKTLSRQNTAQSTHPPSSPAVAREPPQSPAPSEDTLETDTTNSTQSLQAVEQPQSERKHSDNSEPRTSTTSNSAHTISATTEIQRHGALPGDYIPVRVKVEHTRAVRGVVIATLYRQGRIDLLPALPVSNRNKDKKPEYEDVYPKSKTGLGGLYFTNGSPSTAFRMDLTQTSTMMIIDPHTKTSDVSFRVHVPAESFPTMENIPGGMLSFTYHIEVVIDLTGKLGDRSFVPSLTTNGPSFSKAAGPSVNGLTNDWAGNILDTAPLRRTKNVASFELPLVVGTDDTGRARRMKEAQSHIHDHHTHHFTGHTAVGTDYDASQGWHENGFYTYDQWYDHDGYNSYNDGWYDSHGNFHYDGWPDSHQYQHLPPQVNGHEHHRPNDQYHVPPPENEEALDEKARLCRQEELLLPSRPPEEASSSSRAPVLAPSAPVINGHGARPPDSPLPSIPITISRASARSAETIVPDPLTPPPSLPEDGLSASNPTEDKQELERKRLQSQVSAPPQEDGDGTGPSRSQAIETSPSAPTIDDDAEYLAQTLRQDGESLPEYQR